MDKATLDTNYLRHLKPHFLKLFETKIHPAFVIGVFHKYNLNVLTEKDKSLIRAETSNKGHIAGSALLFERLVLYEGWYNCLLDVLRDREVQLAYVAEEMEAIKNFLDEQMFENEMDDVEQILLTKCRIKLENEERKNQQQENIVREKERALQQCALEKAELEEKLKAYHQENAELKNKLEACHQDADTYNAQVIQLKGMIEGEKTKNKQLFLQNQAFEKSANKLKLEISNLKEKLKGSHQAPCAADKIVEDLKNKLATIDIPSDKKRQLERIIDLRKQLQSLHILQKLLQDTMAHSGKAAGRDRAVIKD